MTIDDAAVRLGDAEDTDLRAEARALVATLTREPWGQVSPSLYETARLVTLAPWLTGHERRVRHLLESQRPDGGWGAPGGYALVPTLSATEALLTTLRRREDTGGLVGGGGPHGRLPERVNVQDTHRILHAAGRGLGILERLTRLDATALPDMPAIDLITPSLIRSINRRLEDLARLRPEIAERLRSARLVAPPGLDRGRLDKVRGALKAGVPLPEKVLHALEVADDLARGAATVRPAATGGIGASPAATAAWLDERAAPDPGAPARVFLETVVNGHEGLAPCGIPITVFERSWVLAGLVRAGLVSTVPAALRASLRELSGPAGTPAAEGLPADADTTSVALYALALLGTPEPPDVLWAYETDTHFCTWPGEDGFSVTTNAHALEAFGQFLRASAAGGVGRSVSRSDRERATARYAAAVRKITTVLCEHQQPDGSWTDRWHASPYYATMCCVLALTRFGGERASAPVRRARQWVLDTQRPDGSWGLWEGTDEETAYAVQTLLPSAAVSAELHEAVFRSNEFFLRSAKGSGGRPDGTALWHDKDLYRPEAIARAAVLVARHLVRRYLATKTD
ncbi:prenyltransferase/squalene oxidase repeat-containing protein [Actinomadura miaoliensis]|uniref:Squalene cyclase C-terminal domain-containing protein n=1 Tax=Actinomadura miaoliensis TaxID=430685 RepID=A0ABP7VXW6_9ACTN